MPEFEFNTEIKGVSKETLEAMLTTASTALDNDGHVDPIALLETPSGNVLIAGHFRGDSDAEVEASKNYYALSVRIAAAKYKATTVMFISEAWVASVTEEEMNNGRSLIQPRHRPDRKEAIFANVETYESSYFIRGDIVRDANGKPSVPKFVVAADLKRITGKLCHFLPPKDMDPQKLELIVRMGESILNEK